jgi:hypothetical protein
LEEGVNGSQQALEGRGELASERLNLGNISVTSGGARCAHSEVDDGLNSWGDSVQGGGEVAGDHLLGVFERLAIGTNQGLKHNQEGKRLTSRDGRDDVG